MRSIPLPILLSFSIAFLLRSALRTYYLPTACHRHGLGKPGCLHKLIMTSNIGANYLLEGINEDGTISEQAEGLVMQDLRNHFRPEFLNRLDEIILFKPLSKENIGGIIDLLLKDLNKRLDDRGLSLELTAEAKAFVIENAYDPIYGARPLKRFLQKHVETLAAKLILSDAVGQGDVIVIDVQDGELTARRK